MNKTKAHKTLQAYQKRRFEYIDIWQIAELKLKVYTIKTGELNSDFSHVMDLAQTHVKHNLPKAIEKERFENNGLGFVIIHFGDQHIWLLTHWWADENICCQQMAHSEVDNCKFKNVDHWPLHACVWEHKIINHEHQLWIDTLLNNDSDPNSYLKRHMQNGDY